MILLLLSSIVTATEYPTQKEIDLMCSGKYKKLLHNDIKWKFKTIEFRNGMLMGTENNRSGQVMCSYNLSNIDSNMKKTTGYRMIVVNTDGTWFEN